MTRINENSGAVVLVLFRPICFLIIVLISFASVGHAAETIISPGDSNSRITVENAVVNNDRAELFFLTWPYLGDPNSGKPCPLNYYSVTLQPGLPERQPVPLAREVCGGLEQKSRLLDNGDVLIISGDRLERWRDGQKVESKTFSSIHGLNKLGVTTDMSGGQHFSISAAGDVVVAVQSGGPNQDRGEYGSAALVISSLDPESEHRWEARFGAEEAVNLVKGLWAGPNGSVLLHGSRISGGQESEELLFVSSVGSKKRIKLNEVVETVDYQNMNTMSQADMQKLFERQRDSRPESIERLQAVPRADGGFDILFQRKGEGQDRAGHFLMRIDLNGGLVSERTLGGAVKRHGLENWAGFRVNEGQVVLLSRVSATQPGVNARRKTYAQNVVSWIDLDTGNVDSRLIPLDRRFLEAAMNAGDEQVQNLAGLPGGEPVLLTSVGGKPLDVSVGWISKRQVLRLSEADTKLVAWTGTVDAQRTAQASEQERQQRTARKAAMQQQFNADIAASVGMTPEEFNALSKQEQKEAMIRSGDLEALQAAAMNTAQATQAQQGDSSRSAVTPRQGNAQIAAALAEAQSLMANDPNMTPEMQAQFEAAMAQLGAGSGMPSKAAPGLADKKSGKTAGNTLKVDAGKRGFIEYENPDGRLMTLLIFDRETGTELLKKDYPDGAIYEYVDFSRFDLPLEQIGVLYREVSGLIVEDLTPVISR